MASLDVEDRLQVSLALHASRDFNIPSMSCEWLLPRSRLMLFSSFTDLSQHSEYIDPAPGVSMVKLGT